MYQAVSMMNIYASGVCTPRGDFAGRVLVSILFFRFAVLYFTVLGFGRLASALWAGPRLAYCCG